MYMYYCIVSRCRSRRALSEGQRTEGGSVGSDLFQTSELRRVRCCASFVSTLKQASATCCELFGCFRTLPCRPAPLPVSRTYGKPNGCCPPKTGCPACTSGVPAAAEVDISGGREAVHLGRAAEDFADEASFEKALTFDGERETKEGLQATFSMGVRSYRLQPER